MELKQKSHDKIVQLLEKGVDIPNPLTLDLGEEVSIGRISGQGVKIYPGCRIYGRETVIASGVRLGQEGPVTIEDCQVGPETELKGGYFKKACFLEKANLGLGAHVREGCILEEQAGGAHCVGLKQTILFPFVTLGSLINFCDCLMAGGTSRKDHSEVGSSYIHFNFTPEGDKTTASLLGDVPRGVMLNQPPIFLGGQGGLVGPVRLGFGCVVAAGSILRKDTLESGKLIIGKTHPGGVMDVSPRTYPGLERIIRNNIIYMANLAALKQWYIHVRQPFFQAWEFGGLIYAGALDRLALAQKERARRLKAMADKVPVSPDTGKGETRAAAGRRGFHEKTGQVCELFTGEIADKAGTRHRDRFLAAFENHKRKGADYIEVVQGLPAAVSNEGVLWLDRIIDDLRQRAAAILPSFNIVKKSVSSGG